MVPKNEDEIGWITLMCITYVGMEIIVLSDPGHSLSLNPALPQKSQVKVG
jgi:hypothetical protein